MLSPSGSAEKKSPKISPRSMMSPRGTSSVTNAINLSQIAEDLELSDSSMTDLSALLVPIAERDSLLTKTTKKGVRFADEVDLNEVFEVSRFRNSMLEDMFYGSEDLANFRYEAFMEEAGLDIAEYD
jgi:hypothetical protein